MRVPPNDNMKITKKVIHDFIDILEKKHKAKLGLALIHLLAEAGREIDRASHAERELVIFALATRNIFEIYLIIRNISESDSALDCWYGQMHKDLIDINSGLRKLAEKKELNTEKLDVLDEIYNQALNESPFKSKGQFNIKTIALNYNYGEDYDWLYRLTSKLIHPSSVKVNGFHAIGEVEQYIVALEQSFTYFCMRLEEYILELMNGFKA